MKRLMSIIFFTVLLFVPDTGKAQSSPVFFDIFTDSAPVNQTFDSGFRWSTLGNPAISLQYTLIVPAGISANINDECRSGNGCSYSGNFVNQNTGGISSSIQLKGLRADVYTLTLNWSEIGGLARTGTLTDSVLIASLPVQNNLPFIKTTYLPIAYEGSFYSKRIIVLDADKNADLSLQSITGLPRGLSVDAVVVKDDLLGTKMQFVIKGKPKQAGSFPIQITVSDGLDTATAELLLRVKRL